MRDDIGGDIGGVGGTNEGVDGVTRIDPATIEPVKRGRGRPRKDGAVGGGAGEARSGSGSGKKASNASNLDVGTVTFVVGMVGAFVAQRVGQPALALDQTESRAIADAAANVAKHYDIPISPVYQAWLGLATTIGTIYMTKIALLRMNAELAKNAKPATA
jgi:hypothetical protein